MPTESPCGGCPQNTHLEACTCPWLDCKNHGKCCDCAAHHRKVKHPPLCFPQENIERYLPKN